MIRRILILAAGVLLATQALAAPPDGRSLLIYTVEAGAPADPPPVFAPLGRKGWTIRVNRIAVDFPHEHDLGEALYHQVEAARAEGFTRIALAGRSFGAWVSLIANSSWSTPVQGGRVHAVIAIDPTVSGESARIGTQWHDYKFMDVIKTQDPTRLGIVIVDPNAEDGQDREMEVRRTLRRPAIPNLVIYDPAPPSVDGEAFARRWGRCFATLLGDEIPSPPANDWCRWNN
jgi:hypothetical protein